jgi:hypothetical protein
MWRWLRRLHGRCTWLPQMSSAGCHPVPDQTSPDNNQTNYAQHRVLDDPADA